MYTENFQIYIKGRRKNKMEGPVRGILAGLAAWKLGGGLFSMILIFILVFWLLGKC
jgi:hypothetical protein